MMTRGLWIFVIVNVVVVVITGVAFAALQEQLKQWAGLLMLPLIIVPFVMAYVGHIVSGATGNPFRGLVWGQTGWYFAGWILAMLVGLLTIVITLGLGAAGLDLNFTEYLQLMADQAAKQSGQEMPAEALKALKVSAWATLIGAPIFGAWIGGAIACLSTFPWLGWFTRRMLVYGRATAAWVLMALYAANSCIGALADNPMDEAWTALPLLAKMGIMALSGAAALPAVLWIFYRTRSAVLPALVQAAHQSLFAGMMVVMSDRVSWLAPPNGVLAALVALLVGIGLWVWKDPGGMDLAVAAVAFDGTPLTPEQAKSLQADGETPVATT